MSLEGPLAGATISLLIGLLLGLERERSCSKDEGLFAGIRTFPILALCGFIGASAREAPFALPAVLLAIAALAVASYLRTARDHVGATTEITAILAPLLGAAVAWHQAPLAAALAVIVTLLLTLKAPLHKIAGSVTEDEILAILKFGVVAVVLVPLLPNQPMGPYGALVPRQIGLVVVILSAVSLGGYLLVRILGGRSGWALAGALGGLVSSTAVTLSFSGKARSTPGLAAPLSIGMLLASTVLYLRCLFLVFIFDQPLGVHMAARLTLIFLVGLVLALVGLRKIDGQESGASELGNPVELGRAVGLAALFALILLGARAAQQELGSAGLWAVGLAGGLMDVDSVTVAVSRLHQQGLAPSGVAAGSILLATLSNLAVKAGIVAIVGGRGAWKRVLPPFLAIAAATLGTLAL
jgi:uncharacterized membrane protein (DUF4010 family)